MERPGKATAGRPRSEPDWGNPTVRDRREACGNVDHGGTRHPPRLSKERVLETLRLKSRAPQIYPDCQEDHIIGEDRETAVLLQCKGEANRISRRLPDVHDSARDALCGKRTGGVGSRSLFLLRPSPAPCGTPRVRRPRS